MEKVEFVNNKKSQNHMIKKRLADYYRNIPKENRPSIYSLQQKLADMPGGFEISYNTLNDILSERRTDSAPNIYAVLALCRYWHLDYAAILAPPETRIVPTPSLSSLIEKTRILDDSGYFGLFHGYLYTRNLNRHEIIPFDLNINRNGISVLATMTTFSNPDDVNGNIIPYDVCYEGVPLILTRTNSIFVVLTNIDGYSYILYFDYRHYNMGDLYYRKGIAITTDSTSDKPLLENFVLFRNNITDEKVKSFVPGLLSIIDDSFIITQEAMEELAKDKDMASFFNDYSYNWETKAISGYKILPNHVLESINDKYSNNEMFRVTKALLHMAEKSQSPTRIKYIDPLGMPKFAKTYLQRKD